MKTIILVLAALLAASCSRTDVEKANRSATEYAQHVPGATGVECADSDSDGDGYVSCSVFRGSADPLPIQCGSQKFCFFNCASGCKYVPFKVR